MTSYDEFDNEGPRGWNPLAVALIATLVLLLGLGGALFGINVANKNRQADADHILPLGITPGPDQETPSALPSGTPTATASTPPTTTPPTKPPTTAPTATATQPAGDTFPMPRLAGLDFQTARTKVRDLKLGWRLVFEGTGSDGTVRTTEPVENTVVKRGDTVKILVRGAAPAVTVPNLIGQPCGQAAANIVDKGLYPDYKAGRDGTVQSQKPTPSDSTTLHWNDLVQISCG